MRGIIIKGIGGFYTILADDGREYVCHARGKLRLGEMTPVAGDRVEFDNENEGEPRLTRIFERRNALTRPQIANIDKLFIVMATSAPKPDLLLCDKLLLECDIMGVTPVLVLNKFDEDDAGERDGIARQYAPTGYEIMTTSTVTGYGVDALKRAVSGYVCCFAGQSAVGKSSLLNALVPELELKVGDISRKTERGKHTTRAAELYAAYGGFLADTPGFSLLDAEEMEPHELYKHYPEMKEAGKGCYFAECMHMAEPDCAVKELLKTGGLSKERYERYIILANELIEKRKHRYD